jgi:2-oxoglutarate ferredoxin oxidoreductase subunit alpha
MTETPLVIAVVQRLGPSTGGATQGGQGDVLLTEYCTSGGYTVPVFAPSTARECYDLTRTAFRWAERLRTPVVLLSDKEVGMTMEGVEIDTLEREPVPIRATHAEDTRYLPYAAPCASEPPPFAPVGGPTRVVATGSAHDRAGRLRKNSPEVIEILERLQSKVDAHATEMAAVTADLQPGATTLLVSYGVSARAAREACLELRGQGRSVSWLQVQSLFPVPVEALREAARGCRELVVVEENLPGLYASVLEGVVRDIAIRRVTRAGGMIAPSVIVDACRVA